VAARRARQSNGVVSELDIAKTQLRVDWYTAQVVSALAGRALRPILLKGPAVSRWLYADDRHARPYLDADLLLAPIERGPAERVLAELGFERSAERWPPDEPPHATTWSRPADGAIIDLHRTLHGCEHVPESVVWDVVSTTACGLEVGGITVAVPSVELRTLHIALNAIPGWGAQPFDDLTRAVHVLDRETWEGAVETARALGVADEMGYRLAYFVDGRALAGSLGLSTSVPLRVRPETRALMRLADLHGWRARARFGFGKLFPPPDYLTQVTQVRTGRLGLALGYGKRLGSALRRLPQGIFTMARRSR
jgi:hypothetical protein